MQIRKTDGIIPELNYMSFIKKSKYLHSCFESYHLNTTLTQNYPQNNIEVKVLLKCSRTIYVWNNSLHQKQILSSLLYTGSDTPLQKRKLKGN